MRRPLLGSGMCCEASRPGDNIGGDVPVPACSQAAAGAVAGGDARLSMRAGAEAQHVWFTNSIALAGRCRA